MIILIAGASHTGKTLLAQRLLEKYGYPYLSIDHLKMGLIRSNYTSLTPMSSNRELTNYLWPVVREIIKTAIENRQNLIVEGCYIPFDWAKDFEKEYRSQIQYRCLVMSEAYIRAHYQDIKKYASTVEYRADDGDCTLESLIRDNSEVLEQCRKYGVEYTLIDETYQNCSNHMCWSVSSMDKHTPEQRRKNMQAIKNRDSQIELLLRKELWHRGLRYRKNVSHIYGKPDIVFIGKKIAIFCDSEFWHGYNWDERKKDFKSHQEFWIPKIERNMKRDIEVTEKLQSEGWKVLRFWGKEIKTDVSRCADIIESLLHESQT